MPAAMALSPVSSGSGVHPSVSGLQCPMLFTGSSAPSPLRVTCCGQAARAGTRARYKPAIRAGCVLGMAGVGASQGSRLPIAASQCVRAVRHRVGDIPRFRV